MANWNIDTEKMVDILKSDKPISMGAFEDKGETKLIAVFALPELELQIKEFVDGILNSTQNDR